MLAPPCMRQRVYAIAFLLHIAGARHGAPERVTAPQRGEVDGSPGGLPFSNVPRCWSTRTPFCMGSLKRFCSNASLLSISCF